MVGNLGTIAGTVSLDINPFQSSTRTLNATIKATTQEMRAIDSASDKNGASLSQLGAKYTATQKQIRNYETQLKNQTETYEKLKAKVEETGGANEQLKIRMQNAGAAINRTQNQINRLTQDMTSLNSKINEQGNAWLQASKKYDSYASGMGKAKNGANAVADKTKGMSLAIVGGFTLATKAAMDFNSQIDEIGPLMTNGGKITSEVRQQLDQMGEASKKWAGDYGVSTTAINEGMADLVRAGYDANQTLILTPQILDASRASGEDFNTVLEVVTSTMTQFGIQAKDSSQVTDMMTYAANATKSGFQDLGEALQYTGQSAHAAGIPLSLTVSALGAMSNAGLQGSSAGTAFNMMLQSLATDSGNAKSALRDLGVDIDAFQAGKIDITDVTDQLIKGTKDLTDVQRVAAINNSFGERGGRAILALMNEGGDSLRKLTNETAKANGATAEVAKQMGDTASAKFEKFKQHVMATGIEIGQRLLPEAEKLLNNVDKLITWYDRLDDGQKNNILNWVKTAAAIYPVSKGIGTVTGAGEGMFKMLSFLTGNVGRATSETAKSSGAFNGFAKAVMNGVKQSDSLVGILPAIAGNMNPVMLGISGMGLAVAGTYGIWKLWGEQAYQSSEQTKKWGSAVGTEADQSLSKMKQFSTEGRTSLEQFNAGAKDSATGVTNSFRNMSKEIEQAMKTTSEHFDTVINDTDDPMLQKRLSAQKEARSAELQKQNDRVNELGAVSSSMIEQAHSNNKDLTDDQNAYINRAITQATKISTNMVVQGAEERKRIYATMQGDYNNMSLDQLRITFGDYSKLVNEAKSQAKKSLENNKSLFDSGEISESDFKGNRELIERKQQQQVDSYYKPMLELVKKDKNFADNIKNELVANKGFTPQQINNMSLEEQIGRYYNINFDEVISAGQRLGQSFKETSSIISKGATEADEAWDSIVLDEKTGTVKTNALQVLTEATKTDEGWKKLKFDSKTTTLSSNAKAMLAEALIANGRWNKMKFDELRGLIKTEGGQQIAKALQNSEKWNKMTLQDKQLLVSTPNLGDLGELVEKYGLWNSLPDETKTLLVNSDDAMSKMKGSTEAIKLWQEQHPETKEFKADSSGFDKVVQENIKKINAWNSGLTPIEKIFNANGDKLFKTVGDAKSFIEQYNALPADKKDMYANNVDVMNQVNAAKNIIEQYNMLPAATKMFMGDSSNISSASLSAAGSVNTFNNLMTIDKIFGATDKTGTATNTAVDNLNRFGRRDETYTKTFAIRAQLENFDVLKNFTSNNGVLPKHAKGVSDLPQSQIAMVNDENTSDYHEAIRYPNGQTIIPKGRNVTTFLPKGTSVIPARITKQMFKIPRFAGGTPKYSKAVDEINKLGENMNSTANYSTVTNVNSGGNEQLLKAILEAVTGQQPSINLNINGDINGELSEPMARKWASQLAEPLQRVSRRNTANGGGF